VKGVWSCNQEECEGAGVGGVELRQCFLGEGGGGGGGIQ